VAAKIEWSKTHAKQVMDRAGVPTARWRSGSGESRSDLFDFVLELDGHCVVKADGLAAGKGVAVCDTREEAFAAIAGCLNERRFGDAGNVVVVEDRLHGTEVSVFAVCDGHRYSSSGRTRLQACPRLRPRSNTGGMGGLRSRNRRMPPLGEVAKRVIEPTLAALAEAGTPSSVASTWD